MNRLEIERLEPRRLLTVLPVAHWAFEEGSGTTAVDSSGNGNLGALENGATFGQGLIARYAASFSGTARVQVPNSGFLNPTTPTR